MNSLISYILIGISILLVISILLQRQGAGLGSAFGGSGTMYHSRRGPEKYLFYSSIALAALFVIVALAGALL